MITLIGYGPDDWGKVSAHCSESAQSPINIETSTVKKNSNLKGLRFTCDNKYGKVSGKMVNNGHAPTLVINKGEGTAKLTGGPLGDNVYRLQQLHFHFGCDDDKGSEHTVNGEAYSGEVQWSFISICCDTSCKKIAHCNITVSQRFRCKPKRLYLKNVESFSLLGLL